MRRAGSRPAGVHPAGSANINMCGDLHCVECGCRWAVCARPADLRCEVRVLPRRTPRKTSENQHEDGVQTAPLRRDCSSCGAIVAEAGGSDINIRDIGNVRPLRRVIRAGKRKAARYGRLCPSTNSREALITRKSSALCLIV